MRARCAAGKNQGLRVVEDFGAGTDAGPALARILPSQQREDQAQAFGSVDRCELIDTSQTEELKGQRYEALDFKTPLGQLQTINPRKRRWESLEVR